MSSGFFEKERSGKTNAPLVHTSKNSNSDKVSKREKKVFSLIAQLPCWRGDWRPYLRNYFSFKLRFRYKKKNVYVYMQSIHSC